MQPARRSSRLGPAAAPVPDESSLDHQADSHGGSGGIQDLNAQQQPQPENQTTVEAAEEMGCSRRTTADGSEAADELSGLISDAEEFCE